MTEETQKQTVIFVGGAPRSGTTVTHELICTSSHTNPYHPEISFVLPLISSYVRGNNNWSNHTQAFFAEKDHFRKHVARHVRNSLDHISLVLGNPEILATKDPLMTPLFPMVRELLGDQARFVTVVRHPYNVIRSRQEVAIKSDKPYNKPQARVDTLQFLRSYAHLQDPAMGDCVFSFRYEDILLPETIDGLRKFTGMPDIDPAKVGVKPAPDKGESVESDPWFSPKYHAPIDTKSRLSPLAPRFQAVVKDICGPLMQRFGYTDEA